MTPPTGIGEDESPYRDDWAVLNRVEVKELPAGSGPYVLKKWQPKQRTILARNPQSRRQSRITGVPCASSRNSSP
jgi:ABC-type transport system substrate-binding protein